jgi:hypothetical protein
MDVRAVKDFLGVVSKNLEGHEVTHSFTDTNPVATVFTTVKREWSIIHMVVNWLVESEVKEGTDVICGAKCKL